MPDLYARTLRRAAEVLGSVRELAARLGLPEEDVYMMIQRMREVPLEVFLRATDIIDESADRKG